METVDLTGAWADALKHREVENAVRLKDVEVKFNVSEVQAPKVPKAPVIPTAPVVKHEDEQA
jgi:hypothetical protein